ncbi:MAG: ABC transporter permease subunit, partial [Bdellovibrionales bacterium]|nr:ABC transporter permease subunit [Bdellovibrionales bacterium]
MKGTIAIYKKELLTLLVNPTNYVIAAAFFLVNAYLFFADLGRFNFILNQYQTLPVGMPDVLPNLNEEVIGKYLSSLVLILVFAIPVLSMSAMTEESAQRTFDLLLVSPVKITAIVLGKYLALLTFVLFLTSSALCLPALLLFFGNPEHGPVFSGFVSLILCACAFTSLCLGISAFTKSS